MDQSSYQPDQSRPERRRIRREEIPPTPMTWIISGICVAVYVYANIFRGSEHFETRLALDPVHGQLFPQLFTHVFAHANLMHIGSNLLGIVIIGRYMEIQYGSWRFLALFYLSALLAGMAQAAWSPGNALLGASGGLFALLAAFVRHFPNVRFYLLFPPLPWPVPAWLLVAGMALFNIALGVGEYMGIPWLQSNIAYVAHLAGLLAGFTLSLILFPPLKLLPGESGYRENIDN